MHYRDTIHPELLDETVEEPIASAPIETVSPGFRATAYVPTTINGEAWESAECFDYVDGRWEGFVSIRRTE